MCFRLYFCECVSRITLVCMCEFAYIFVHMYVRLLLFRVCVCVFFYIFVHVYACVCVRLHFF